MNLQNFNDVGDLGVGSNVTGNYSQNDVATLMKAMTADHITGRETTDMLTAGSALKVESLENTQKILTAQAKHMPLFSRIAKLPAFSTVEEYNQLVSYGDLEGGFISEGETPETSDSQYTRKAQLVKYLGVVGGVTHQAQLVNMNGVANMITAMTKNKSMEIMQLMERYLPFADSRVVPENFNGFFQQHEVNSGYGTLDAYLNSEHVIDCHGKVLTDSDVEAASLTVVNSYGAPDTLIGPPSVFSNFVSRYHDKKLINPVPSMVRDGVFGQRVNEIITQNGGIEIVQSNFFKDRSQKKKSSAAASQKAPAAPTALTATPASDKLSKAGVNGAGDYYYAVAAKNKFGESPLCFAKGLVTVTASQAVDLKFTPGAGTYPATGYVVYKSEINPVHDEDNVVMHKVFEVGQAQVDSGHDGATAGQIRDRLRFIPATDQAYMVEWDSDQVFAFKQLAPLMKMNLAITGPISKFMILLYGTPILYAPRKTVRFINIGNQLS